MSEDLIDSMELEALFEAEFWSVDSQSMEDLFSEALDSIEVARKKVDRMLPAGVSPSILVVENKTRALAAKGKGRQGGLKEFVGG